LSNLKLLPLIILPITLLISSSVADFVIILSVIFFLIISIKNKNFYWIKDKYFILLFIFYIYLLVNFYFSQSREESLGRAFGFIRFPLFIMSVKYFFLKDFSKINLIIKFWLIIIIIVLVDTLIQYQYGKNILGYPSLTLGGHVRLSSFLNKEYKIGGYLFVFSFIIFSYFAETTYKKSFYNKLLILLFYLLALMSIYFTGERSNFIIFCLCSILFIFFSDFKVKYKIVSFLFLLIFIVFLLKLNSKLKIRFVDETIDIIYSQKLNFKETILQSQYGAHYITAYKIFKDYPFIGSGIKTFRVVCEEKKYENYNIPWIKHRCTTHPHNVILEFLSELGIVGALLFLSFFIYLMFTNVISFLRSKNNFLLGLIICSVLFYFPMLPRGSFFTNWNAVIFWTIISLLISFSNIRKNKF
jgi:O-antigen ligase